MYFLQNKQMNCDIIRNMYLASAPISWFIVPKILEISEVTSVFLYANEMTSA